MVLENELIAAKRVHRGLESEFSNGKNGYRQSLEPVRLEGRTIIQKEYRDVPVPADCALRPDTAGLLESARQRANAAASGQPGKSVPLDPVSSVD